MSDRSLVSVDLNICMDTQNTTLDILKRASFCKNNKSLRSNIQNHGIVVRVAPNPGLKGVTSSAVQCSAISYFHQVVMTTKVIYR